MEQIILQRVADNNEHLFLTRVVAQRLDLILFYPVCAQLGRLLHLSLTVLGPVAV